MLQLTKLCLLFLSLFVIVQVANATLGVDLSQATSESDFACLVKNGYTYAIIRCWCSYGGSDPNCPTSIKNAWAAKMSHVDAYMFPCAGQSAATQVQDLVNYLKGSKYGQIWFDIENNPSSGCGWGSASDNCNYMSELISEAVKLGVNPGVYASEYMWGHIMGSGCTVASKYALWYADYDNSPSFGGFAPFGGWSKPAMKQYKGSTSLCGTGVDLDYYPS
eukprot:TRINITY_DN297_c0_g1_i2.p1 TRINITY_DN297_c0_g1~~TRINITY_DN297_c0_g1_i2.p1  ORF type:complete len:220 (-),score=28.46 TRINITY_DN297_c0_g1_i2:88-747(-)